MLTLCIARGKGLLCSVFLHGGQNSIQNFNQQDNSVVPHLTATTCLCDTDSNAHLMIQALPCYCTHYPHPCPILSTGQRLVLMSPCRVIASQASVPLVYVPLEAVASKWYGESERLLSEVFKAAETLPGCIIFLDEVDSLATSRYK